MSYHDESDVIGQTLRGALIYRNCHCGLCVSRRGDVPPIQPHRREGAPEVVLRIPVVAQAVVDLSDEDFENFITLIRASRCLHCGSRAARCHCQNDE